MQSGTENRNMYEGSVAYDLSRFDRRRRVREALENEKVVTPELPAKPKTKTADKADAHPRIRVSAFAVLSYVVVFALLLGIVMNYMILNEVTVETARLENELHSLESDAAKLEVEYERAMSLSELAAKAQEIGMYAPGSDQVDYIDISRSDEVTVYSSGEGEGFFAGLEKALIGIGDYFSGE